MRRILLKMVSLVALLALALLSVFWKYQYYGIYTEAAVSHEFLEVQGRGAESYRALIYSFAEEGKTMPLGFFPDYYAGAYLDDEGCLVVLTHDASEQDIDHISSVCSNNEIRFERRDYSLAYLVEIKDTIWEHLQNLYKNGIIEHYSVSIIQESGTIEIGLEKTAVHLEAAIDELVLSTFGNRGLEHVTYCCVDDVHAFLNVLHMGDYTQSGYSEGTIGFKARYTDGDTTLYGFVTAGHVAYWSSYMYTAGNIFTRQKMGNVIVGQDSGYTDAAFVETVDNYYVSFSVNGYDLKNGAYGLPPDNMLVYSKGYVSGTTSGYITCSMYSNETYTYLIQTNVSTQHGDSGSLLYYVSGTKAWVIGVLHGGNTTSGPSTFSYYSNGALFPWEVWPVT